MPVLLEEPHLGLPGAQIPRYTGFHAEAILLRSPAHEPAGCEVYAELVLVQTAVVLLDAPEGIFAKFSEGNNILDRSVPVKQGNG